ncbi:restriction endonuclease subunit S [Segatella copri]|uniref:restriction endonuclease subunit S n=1 Tax=Segatella copri TaxID=165179 RepID=UPI003F703A29
MEWKEVKIGDLGQIITGKTPKTAIKKNWGGKIPFLSPSDDMSNKTSPVTARTLTELGVAEVAKCLIPANSICVSCIGSDLGKVVKTDRELVTNQQINTIVPHSNIDSDFVYYLMCIVGKELNYISKTSTAVPIINKSTFSDWDIVIPREKEDQRRIASILSSLDRKIELNNKINADLEEMAQAIFKNWFVDFEPFKDGKFVDSELGMIPEGWKVGRLTDVIKLMPGGTPKTSEPLYWDNGTIPFFSPKDVNGVYCFATEKHITEAGLNKCSSNLYPKDTIFITCRGTVGKVCLVACDMAMNQSNYAIKAIDGYSQYYVFFLVKSVVERLIKKSNGAVFSAITSKDFDEEILIPSQKAVEDFTNVIDGFFRRIFTIGTESSRLSLLRDTLLPRLMSGELEVPE